MSKHSILETNAAGGFFRRKPAHVPPPGAPCANCATPLAGPWCHACGQKGEDFHRSIGHLTAEAAEGLTHFDGRGWGTVLRLIANPARLTNDFIHGKRAPQIPPFRLFLVVLLVLFLAGGLKFGQDPKAGHGRLQTAEQAAAQRQADTRHAFEVMRENGARPGVGPLERWFEDRALKASSDPEAVAAAMEHWAHRFAILMLPISAAILAAIFALDRWSKSRPRFFVFDHLIFSMHSLSFTGLVFSIVLAFDGLWEGVGLLIFAAPVHLFFHMRGVYRTSIVGTLARMSVLAVASVFAFVGLLLGLVLIGLSAVH